MQAHIFQLNCSRGGVPKLSVRDAMLTPMGLEGDQQKHTKVHGGPQRALCLYSLERIMELQGEGHPIYPGSIGENVTITGLDWARLQPGVRLALGPEALIEITSYTAPCKNIAASFVDGQFMRVAQPVHPGESRVYARVLQTGRLFVGQPVQLLLPVLQESM